MEYDSVLGKQSISGKNISLILCAWKPCYVKSGHNCGSLSLSLQSKDSTCFALESDLICILLASRFT